MNKGQNKAYFKLSLIRIISYLSDYLIFSINSRQLGRPVDLEAA